MITSGVESVCNVAAIHISCVMLLLAVAPAHGEEQSWRVECLGIPVKSVVYGNSHGVLARSPAGQADMFYISYYSSTGCELLGYHAKTGETVKVRLGSKGGYGCCVGSDGAIYVGGVGPADIYRFDPAVGTLENLGGRAMCGEYVWDMAASRDGKIYAACYPKGNVVEYDIVTKKFRDLGPMMTKEQYVRAICIDGQGKVWAGIGTHAHIVVLDPASGQKRDVLPEEYQRNSTCYSLNAHGNYVFASLIFDGVLLVYDTRTLKVVHTVKCPEGDVFWMNCKAPGAGHAYLCAIPSGDLYTYDVATQRLEKVADFLGQCEVVQAQRYVHGIADQEYFLYDLKENKWLVHRKLAEATDGMQIFTLTAGPDGNIYGSTYINQHLFRCQSETGKLTDLGKIVRMGGQADSITCGWDGKIYIGSYSFAVLSVYDPARPWQPGTSPDSNPREIGPIGHGQYRTRCITLGPDGRIYVGSIPSYNSAPTGAFTRCDPKTGEKKVWTDLVPGGAVHSMVSDKRYIYASGGGRFFAFDPQTEKKIYETTLAATAMVLTKEGLVVGSAKDKIFVFDPAQMKMREDFACHAGELKAMTLGHDGAVYGINDKTIVRIDVANKQVTQIAKGGGSFLAADRKGRLYFARGARLLRLIHQ